MSKDNMNENKKPLIPDELSSIADDDAIREIDFGDFLEESNASAPLFEGFHEDIERTEKSLENELQSLYDDIMNSGPNTIVPKPLSVLTSSEAEPEKIALADPENDAETAENVWADPDEFFEDDIPVVSLDGGAAEKAAETPVSYDDAKNDIFSLIDMLKSDTSNDQGFNDILSEIESNNEIVPVASELSAAAHLVSSLPEADVEEEELDMDSFEEEVPAAEPVPEINTSDEDFERELAELLGDAPAEAPAEEAVAESEPSGFVISVPDDGNDYEKAAAAPEKLYQSTPMSSATLADDPEINPDSFIEEPAPEKKEPSGAGEIVRKIVLAISIITIIVSSGILVNTYFIEPYRFKADAEKLEAQMNESINNHSDLIVEEVNVADTNVNYPEGMLAKYAQLYAANDDLAGWISIPGFEINLPIVQGNDNSYYLKKDVYGKYTRYGVPFFDYRMTDLQNLHRNTVVYGHNMRYDDLIFGMLENYRGIEDGFARAPVIECNTIYGDHTWFVYAAFLTNSKESDDNGYVLPYNFIDIGEQKFEEYIDEIDKRKFYTTGIDIAPTDKILTLSTCAYDFDDARLVVIARERREGESINIDVSKAYYNQNPKYPQAWYDINKKTNPYAEDSRW